MKPISAVIVFLLLLTMSVGTSAWNYRKAHDRLVAELSSALEKTLLAQRDVTITGDTIRAYRQLLSTPQLKATASIAPASAHMPRRMLCSNTLVWCNAQRQMAVKGGAMCTAATIFRQSDQSLPALLLSLSLLWGTLSVGYFRRKKAQPAACSAATCDISALRLTPMQRQLMQLFAAAEGQRLTREQICQALWPKKPDASETLYSLIRRLKQSLSEQSDLTIENERGEAYRLRR